MPQIKVLGLDVFYRDEGVGPIVLLGHSSSASSGQWRPLLARLKDRYRLIAFSNTTRAAQGVVEVLRGVWPAATYTEIAGAGHMSPLTHAERVNDVIQRFLEEHTTHTRDFCRVGCR